EPSLRPAMRLVLALALALALALIVPSALARSSDPVPVDVQVYIINIGNYDATKGTYVVDMYLTLSWNASSAPANFTPARYEFMNGRASSTDKLSDDTDANGTRTLNYRVQANLYSSPHFEKYPYDTQTIEVVFEDALHPREELVYAPDLGGS